MIKPAGGMCNLACKYCFYCDVIESRKTQNFTKTIMDYDTQKRLVLEALEYANGDEIYFAFQGGEPLLAGLDYYKNFVKLVKENNKLGSKIFYNIQTNGTLINTDWATFFKDNDFLLGLSLDGNKLSNVYRKTKYNIDTFDLVYEKTHILKRYKVDFNMLVVLTDLVSKNIKEIYQFFKKENLSFLQFTPCLNPFNKSSEKKFLTEKGMKIFLDEAFTLYAKDFLNDSYVSIRLFDNWVRIFLSEPPEQCGLMGYCYRQVVSEYNGDIYPCDFYCIDEYKLGNINDTSLKTLLSSNIAKSFIESSFKIDSKCKDCKYYNICRQGGCKRLRQSDDFCKVYKEFFKKAEPLFNAIKLKILNEGKHFRRAYTDN